MKKRFKKITIFNFFKLKLIFLLKNIFLNYGTLVKNPTKGVPEYWIGSGTHIIQISIVVIRSSHHVSLLQPFSLIHVNNGSLFLYMHTWVGIRVKALGCRYLSWFEMQAWHDRLFLLPPHFTLDLIQFPFCFNLHFIFKPKI